MSEIREEFLNGFCKAQNQTRTVLCEFEETADGRVIFQEADCAYGACQHTENCILMAQIAEIER